MTEASSFALIITRLGRGAEVSSPHLLSRVRAWSRGATENLVCAASTIPAATLPENAAH
jgi:hypothetical protein